MHQLTTGCPLFRGNSPSLTVPLFAVQKTGTVRVGWLALVVSCLSYEIPKEINQTKEVLL
jgi:hypothetical protein